MCFRQPLTWTFLIKSCLFHMLFCMYYCDWNMLRVWSEYGNCFVSVFMCSIPKKYFRGWRRKKKTLLFVTWTEESLVLVLNHLVLWFKEKDWITVEIWFLTNCRRCCLMLVVKEILKTTVTDGLPQRLQRWRAGGAASYLSATNSHSCANRVENCTTDFWVHSMGSLFITF